MAKIGLSNFKYSILDLTDPAKPTYSGAETLGKAVEAKVEIKNNDAVLYADDAVAESDTSFANGTITLTIDEDDDAVFAKLLGHKTVTGTDGDGLEVIRSSTDTAPYVGVGRIITKMINGVYKYKVEFLKKVKFSEPSQDNSTKGENIEFGTTEVEGTIVTMPDGTWSQAKTFTDLAKAQTYLDGLMTKTSG